MAMGVSRNLSSNTDTSCPGQASELRILIRNARFLVTVLSHSEFELDSGDQNMPCYVYFELVTLASGGAKVAL